MNYLLNAMLEYCLNNLKNVHPFSLKKVSANLDKILSKLQQSKLSKCAIRIELNQ